MDFPTAGLRSLSVDSAGAPPRSLFLSVEVRRAGRRPATVRALAARWAPRCRTPAASRDLAAASELETGGPPRDLRRQRTESVENQSETGLEDLVGSARRLGPALRTYPFDQRRSDRITIDHV